MKLDVQSCDFFTNQSAKFQDSISMLLNFFDMVCFHGLPMSCLNQNSRERRVTVILIRL